jgi:hypothetical protein
MNVEAALRIVAENFPGVFPNEADYAVPDDLVRFMTTPVEGQQYDPSQLCCTPQGVVEVALPIDHDLGNEAAPVIRAVAIAGVAADLHRAVADGLYENVYGTQPKRLDWMLNVSPNISGPTGPRPWTGIVFPRSVPAGRAIGAMPSADVRGYGRSKSQSLPVGAPLRNHLAPLLADFLERNSYRGIDHAVADTVEAVSRRG